MRLSLAVLLLVVFAATAQGAVHPQLRLLDLSPASVAGTGFRPSEHVVVTVTGGSNRLRRSVVTSARGAFVARFATPIAAPGCSQLAIVAVGARGDRASWKSPPKSCGPPLAP
jgi:hypothetical protein